MTKSKKVNNEAPDFETFKKNIKNYLYKKFGPILYWTLLVIFFIPGIIFREPLINLGANAFNCIKEFLTRESIPEADTTRFSVMVAHLENDDRFEQERLIIAALSEFKSIQTLSLDRTIGLEGAIPEDMAKKGQERAKDYLRKSGASVLIWGKVLRKGNDVVPELFWTTSDEEKQRVSRIDAPRVEEKLRLPRLFWSDLSEILRLIIATSHSEFMVIRGHYVVDQVAPFAQRVKKLLTSKGLIGWDSESTAEVHFLLGNALSVHGEQSGSREPLEEAASAYREALKERTRERVPLDWAQTQNNLGNALGILGERESGTERLEEAVSAFREALKEWTREQVPLDWASTQNNLGNALQALGIRESGTGRLEEAVSAYREALKEWTREQVPLDWATTQNNLGNALQALGSRESGTGRLEEAVFAFRGALKERTQEKVPLDWATTQNNLGSVLSVLGERENSTERLEEAVSAFREALKERTQEKVPLDWAQTQNNIGNTLLALGSRESGTGRLKEAVSAFREALKQLTRERVPLDWATTQNNLAVVLSVLGERESSTERLEEAVSAFQEALKERTRERAPLYWAKTQNNLGYALRVLGERESGTERLEEAVVTFKGALDVLKSTSNRYQIEIAQKNLRITENALSKRRGP